MIPKKILVIIPAYNESGNIKRTIQELKSLSLGLDLLVIDDGSLDPTAKEAKEEKVNVISLPFNLGIGGAVQTGFQYALAFHYDLVVQVDGDGQHDVRYVEKLLNPLIQDKADLVLGSRFIKPFLGYRSSFIRRVGILFFAYLISFLTRYKITDSTSGFRAFNRKCILIFSKNYPHDYPEPESIVVAKRSGLRLIEIPVEMRKRYSGYSSIRYLMTLYYMVKVTFAILLCMLKNKPRFEQ